VEFGIIEPDGKLSVLKKSQYQTVTARDLNLNTGYKWLPISKVVERKIFKKGLINPGTGFWGKRAGFVF